jgi:hypothetical protein
MLKKVTFVGRCAAARRRRFRPPRVMQRASTRLSDPRVNARDARQPDRERPGQRTSARLVSGDASLLRFGANQSAIANVVYASLQPVGLASERAMRSDRPGRWWVATVVCLSIAAGRAVGAARRHLRPRESRRVARLLLRRFRRHWRPRAHCAARATPRLPRRFRTERRRHRLGSRGPGAKAFWAAAERAKSSPKWRYCEVATNHMIPNNRPTELAQLLLELA